MSLRVRSVLFLILGLTAAASVFAQGNATRAAAVVKDMQGALTVQSGTGVPQASKPGAVLPVGSILRTGANSATTLVFSDGQICALGEKSSLRIANYVYIPKASSGNEMSLNLIGGSLRCVMGAIAELNPAAVRLQVGVATIGVSPSSASRTDTSAVVEAGTMAVTVERGSVVVSLPSGPPQSVAAGQGLFFAQDGTVVSGTTAEILQQLGALPQGLQMQQQFAALEGASQGIAVTVAMLSNTATAQELLAPLGKLPPEEVLILQMPQLNTASTPPTGAGGGGLPCTASCN